MNCDSQTIGGLGRYLQPDEYVIFIKCTGLLSEVFYDNKIIKFLTSSLIKNFEVINNESN